MGARDPVAGRGVRQTGRRGLRTPLAALALAGALAGLTTDCGGGGSDGALDPAAVAVGLDLVAAGLDVPLDLTAPADDPRLFIVERAGRIRIVRDGALLATPFLDLSGEISTGNERGLLGLAFHPAYASNGHFFVHFTDTAGDVRVVRYGVSGNPDVADSGSAFEVLFVEQPFGNHNGGKLVFGPDGFLYVGLGDGGSAGDPQGNGQSLGTLLGKILRLDVDGAAPYAIPPGNPFAGSPGARGEIWAYGLRNPWRFAFDRATDDLYIADVGQNEREEVDFAGTASGGGENYGWNVMEGSSCFEAPDCARGGLVLPIHEYDHSDGCSITGGYVYRGSAVPAITGRYFYGDFCEGFVRSLRVSDGRATETVDWPHLAPGGQITSFGEDAAGELYVLVASGAVFRIAPR